MMRASRETLDQEIQHQTRLVRGLMAALYAGNEETPDESLLRELAEAKATLRELQRRHDAERSEAAQTQAGPRKAMGVPLGPETTGLRVVTTVRLQPIPTGVYHLLDPQTDPLLTVTVKNESHEPKRICVTAFLEGLSARAIKTVELGRMDKVGQTINLLPSLVPEQARRITEVQRCTCTSRLWTWTRRSSPRTRTASYSWPATPASIRSSTPKPAGPAT